MVRRYLYPPKDEDESLEFDECLLRFFFFFDDSLAVSLLSTALQIRKIKNNPLSF
jgi:hypothetical protein